jgi:hypothetical protein
MNWPHLFEFMDLEWLPGSLRGTLREILECGSSLPFRPYYRWVADEVLRAAQEFKCTRVVELGAGTAPVTRLMARDSRSEGLQLVVCDSNPDRTAYEELERAYPDKVFPCYEPVDFSLPQPIVSNTLFFLSAALHHVPSPARVRILDTLVRSSSLVLVFEPLRKTVTSLFFVLPSVVPAMLLPIWFLHRPGRVRRFLWCWFIPVAPVLFWWDGWVSCLRQWTDTEWQPALQHIRGEAHTTEVHSSTFCQMVSWRDSAINERPFPIREGSSRT